MSHWYLDQAIERANRRAQRTGIPRCPAHVDRQGDFPAHQCLLPGRYNGYCRNHHPNKHRVVHQRRVQEAIRLLIKEGFQVLDKGGHRVGTKPGGAVEPPA